MTYLECLRGTLVAAGFIAWVCGSISAAVLGVCSWDDRPRWLCVTMAAGGFVSLTFAVATIIYVSGK